MPSSHLIFCCPLLLLPPIPPSIRVFSNELTYKLRLFYIHSKSLISDSLKNNRRRQWHPTPVLLPGKSHGWRNLEGCSPWGRWGSDMTEQLHFHFSLSCIGEGNGNPLQCSCLENPRDRKPGGLPSMGSHRVRHNWSDSAAAAKTNNQELWQHWPTVLNDNIWLEMNSARFVYLGCVVGCHTYFHLTLLIYVTFLALKMSEPASLGWHDLLSVFIPDAPQHLLICPQLYFFLAPSHSHEKDTAVLCLVHQNLSIPWVRAVVCLCSVSKLRWEAWEKKRGKGDTKTWEEMIEKGN